MKFAHNLALVAFCLLLASCTRGFDKGPSFPANPPLSSGLGWGLISESYVRLKTDRLIAASDIAHLRDGSLVELKGRESGEGRKPGSRGFWYLVKAEEGEGWVRDSELVVFATKVQAERAKAGEK